MANQSISPTQRAECIRLQADRVVRAYRTLRASAHSADFTSDDFPVGLFAELFQQIKQLDGWLDTPPSDPEPDSVAETDSEHIERELTNVREIVDQIEHLATHGNDATMLGVIKRLARDAQSTLYGKVWDRLADVLEHEVYRPAYGELWSVIEDFSADELMALRSHAAAIRTRRS
jgi:hypothetical protein